MIKWWHARFDEASRDERVLIAVLGKLKDADAMPAPSKLAPDQKYGTPAILKSSKEADGDEEVLAGYVTLHKPITETGPFRGPIEKLLVNPRFRFRGIARTMMEKAEVVGREQGRTLLVSHTNGLSGYSTTELLRCVAVVLMHCQTLDTMTASGAEVMYKKIGYTQLGDHIPDYGLYPDGTMGGGTFFFKVRSLSSTMLLGLSSNLILAPGSQKRGLVDGDKGLIITNHPESRVWCELVLLRFIFRLQI